MSDIREEIIKIFDVDLGLSSDLIKQTWTDKILAHPNIAIINPDAELSEDLITDLCYEFFLTKEQVGVLLLRLDKAGYEKVVKVAQGNLWKVR